MAAKKKARKKAPGGKHEAPAESNPLSGLSLKQLHDRDLGLAQQGVHQWSAERKAIRAELRVRGIEANIVEEKGTAVSREEFYAQVIYGLAQSQGPGAFTDREIGEVAILAGNARWAYLKILGADEEAAEERKRTTALRADLEEEVRHIAKGGYGPPARPAPRPAPVEAKTRQNVIDEQFAADEAELSEAFAD